MKEEVETNHRDVPLFLRDRENYEEGYEEGYKEGYEEALLVSKLYILEEKSVEEIVEITRLEIDIVKEIVDGINTALE